jgi:hypothetical protein
MISLRGSVGLVRWEEDVEHGDEGWPEEGRRFVSVVGRIEMDGGRLRVYGLSQFDAESWNRFIKTATHAKIVIIETIQTMNDAFRTSIFKWKMTT